MWSLWLRMPENTRKLIYRIAALFSHKTTSFRVCRLPFGLYIKSGDHHLIAEALATQYVSLNTSIPVPTILDVIENDSKFGTMFLMTEVPGRTLPDTGVDLNMISEEKLAIFSNTIRDWISQLRSLAPPPGDSICGFLGGKFYSYRIKCDHAVGPFESQHIFHAQYFCELRMKEDEPDYQRITALSYAMRRKCYRLCLTHGDLTPNNILVDENYKPTGLVDWQCAAWMPEYWELTSAMWRRQRYPAWNTAFTQAFPQYADEVAVEAELWKTICPW